MSEAAYYQHHLAEDIGEPGQPEGAGARGGRRWQVLPHAQVGCPSLLLQSSIWFRFTDEKFSADLLPTVGIDFRVKVNDQKTQTCLC